MSTNRRDFLRSIVATFALSTGLARTSFALADGAGFESDPSLLNSIKEAFRDAEAFHKPDIIVVSKAAKDAFWEIVHDH